MSIDTDAIRVYWDKANGIGVLNIYELCDEVDRLTVENKELKEQIGCIQAICDNAYEYKVNDFITAIRHALSPKEKV